MATIGVTAFAADALGDVVYVELPDVGATLDVGRMCGEIESTKSVSEIVCPVHGVVTQVNQEVVDEPAIVNRDPYGKGWLFQVELSGMAELLSATQYTALIESGDAP